MITSFDNNTPIYIQIVENIKMEIISGKLKCGDRIQPVRELALTAKVNPNTMQKALVELENQKLIHTESTNGRYVTNDISTINKLKTEFIEKKMKNLINDMKNIGITSKEVIEYLQNIDKEK